MNWKEHEFDFPLGIELPDVEVSSYEDWWDDCEEDDVFELKPCYYTSKEKYDAALQLCKICGGWFYYESDQQMKDDVALLEQIITASDENPFQYYNVQYEEFDWVSALRENNPKYINCLYDIDGLWELYYRLGERSVLEKALCYEWLISYFNGYANKNQLENLYNGYLQNYNGEAEMILYLRPNQISLLTTGDTAVPTNCLPELASAAAGLIRLGKREEGIALYTDVFALAWERKASSDVKKEVMDRFMERLSKGYENEPYIDSELSDLLQKQCEKYTDSKWVAKMKVSLGRNGF